MPISRFATRTALVAASAGLGLTALLATATGAAAAATGGSCVGQLASTAGASMSQIVNGWQNGQPNPPGFAVPGQYAANLAQATTCPA